MAWFKVDDSLAFHRKVLAAGNAAMGLWVRAGSWSAQQLEDGRVPAHVAAAMGTAEEAAALVREGLWLELEEGGYVFHDWDERQPSRADVLARREAEAEKKRVARAAAAARREREQGASPRASRGVSPGDGRGDSGAVSPGESALPDPTRPDPTHTPTGGARKRATRIPEPFVVTGAMREWAAREVPGLDVDGSTRKFVDYWRAAGGRSATKLDWVATWRNWLRSDFERRPQGQLSSAARAAQQALALEAMEQERGELSA